MGGYAGSPAQTSTPSSPRTCLNWFLGPSRMPRYPPPLAHHLTSLSNLQALCSDCKNVPETALGRSACLVGPLLPPPFHSPPRMQSFASRMDKIMKLSVRLAPLLCAAWRAHWSRGNGITSTQHLWQGGGGECQPSNPAIAIDGHRDPVIALACSVWERSPCHCTGL